MEKSKDLKLFTKYVSFNIFSMLGLSCYILVDTYFIANGIGENGLTALNLALPMFSFINGIGLMLGIGGGTKFAIAKATGQKEEGSRIYTTVIISALSVAVIFIVLGIFASDKISLLLGADKEMLSMTKSYLRIIMLFSPAFMLNGITNCFVKNDGDPRRAMCAMLSGSCLNIVLDYIFIYPMNLGISGAALATGAAPITGLLILSTHFTKDKSNFKLIKTGFKKNILKECIPLGIPAMVNELSVGAVIIIFNTLILNISGNIGVAAYGIVANISLVVVSIFTGIAQGMQPVVSEAYGQKMKKRLHNLIKYGITTTIALSLIVYTVLYIFAPEVSSLFNKNNDQELMQMAVSGIRIYFAGILGAGLNITLASLYASMENKIPAQIISLLRGLILIIPIAFILSHIAGLTGIWLAFPMAEGLTAVFSIFILVKSNLICFEKKNRLE